MEKHIIMWPGWETVRLIGRGSFGAVYEIQRQVFDNTEKAALKVISIPQNPGDIDEMYSEGYDEEGINSTFQSYLKSIVEEYSLMRKLNGNLNIVHCDDVKYIQHDDGIGWDIFIKMELLTPLTKTLSEEIPEETVIKVAKDLCTALMECKKHDIVHRDIKPQNIFVSSNGDFKLGDFGIAKTAEKTIAGTQSGTYKYMAPEVYNNQPYGSSVDIYSLGLVLYWMLNERRMPFMPLPPVKQTGSMEEEARRRRFAGESIPAPKNGSNELKEIVLKACAYDPKKRFRTAKEMLDELNAIGKVPPPDPEPDPIPTPPVPLPAKKKGYIPYLLAVAILTIMIGFTARSCKTEDSIEIPQQNSQTEPTIHQQQSAYCVAADSDRIMVGQTTCVAFIVDEYTYRSDDALNWSSSDTDVAEVSSDGTVTGVSAGTVVITGSLNGRQASVAISVEAEEQQVTEVETVVIPTVEWVQVNLRSSQLLVGDTMDVWLSTDGWHLDGESEGIEWSVDDPSVAVVDNQGRVTALRTGTCHVTAVYQGLTDSKELTVAAVDSNSGAKVTADFNKLSLRAGNSDTVNITFSGNMPEQVGATAYYSAGLQAVLKWGTLTGDTIPLEIQVLYADTAEGCVTVLVYDQNDPDHIVASTKLQIKIN